MGDQHGGKRKGAGRKKGSKTRTTIAREVIGEIIDAPDPMKLASAIHQRGHAMLLELERIVLDPTQPIAARIMAARTALANHASQVSEFSVLRWEIPLGCKDGQKHLAEAREITADHMCKNAGT